MTDLKKRLKKAAAIATAATATMAATFGGAVAMDTLKDSFKFEQKVSNKQLQYINEANEINAEAHAVFNKIKTCPGFETAKEAEAILTDTGETYVRITPQPKNNVYPQDRMEYDYYQLQKDGTFKYVDFDIVPSSTNIVQEILKGNLEKGSSKTYTFKNGTYQLHIEELTRDPKKKDQVLSRFTKMAHGGLGNECTQIQDRDKKVYFHKEENRAYLIINDNDGNRTYFPEGLLKAEPMPEKPKSTSQIVANRLQAER